MSPQPISQLMPVPGSFMTDMATESLPLCLSFREEIIVIQGALLIPSELAIA